MRVISASDVRAAAERIKGRVLRTPAVYSHALSKKLGAHVTLKLDNLQTVGSFKERGAANCLALLTEEERRRGVIAVSAGNHAQGVARHASLLGINAVIVMPRFTPSAKVTRTASWGARIVLHGDGFAEATAHAHELCAKEGLTFIHPFDDAAIMAGQGTAALELLEDMDEAPDFIILPIGGGGLISGCAAIVSELSPKTEIIGVQAEHYASLARFPDAETTPKGGATIAEGIAVIKVGEKTRPFITRHVSRVICVSESEIETAITLMAEATKQVSEGAGAAGVAAMLSAPDMFEGKRVALIVSGGNIDTRILANTLMRSLLRDGRLLRLKMAIPDRPGILADISRIIGESGGNIIEVSHQRLFSAPSVQTAELEIMLEARDPEHARTISDALSRTYTLI